MSARWAARSHAAPSTSRGLCQHSPHRVPHLASPRKQTNIFKLVFFFSLALLSVPIFEHEAAGYGAGCPVPREGCGLMFGRPHGLWAERDVQQGERGEEGHSVALQTACPQGWILSVSTLGFRGVLSPGKRPSGAVGHVPHPHGAGARLSPAQPDPVLPEKLGVS